MVSMMSGEIFTDNDRDLSGMLQPFLKLELHKTTPLFARTNVIFEIWVSFSTIYQKRVLALQFSFNLFPIIFLHSLRNCILW